MHLLNPALIRREDIEASIRLTYQIKNNSTSSRFPIQDIDYSPAEHVYQSTGLSSPTGTDLSDSLLASAHTPAVEFDSEYDPQQAQVYDHCFAMDNSNIDPSMLCSPSADAQDSQANSPDPFLALTTDMHAPRQSTLPQPAQYYHAQQPTQPAQHISNLARSHLEFGATQIDRAMSSNYSAMQRYCAQRNAGQMWNPTNTGTRSFTAHPSEQQRTSAFSFNPQLTPVPSQHQRASPNNLQFGPQLPHVASATAQQQHQHRLSNSVNPNAVSSQPLMSQHSRSDSNTTMVGTPIDSEGFTTPERQATVVGPRTYTYNHSNSLSGSGLSAEFGSALMDLPPPMELVQGRARGFYFTGTTDFTYSPAGEDSVYTLTECAVIWILQHLNHDLDTIVEVLRYHRSDYSFSPDLSRFNERIASLGGEAFQRLATLRYGAAQNSWIAFVEWTYSTWLDGMGAIVQRAFDEGTINFDGFVTASTDHAAPSASPTWEQVLHSADGDAEMCDAGTPQPLHDVQRARPSVWEQAGCRNPLVLRSQTAGHQRVQHEQVVAEPGQQMRLTNDHDHRGSSNSSASSGRSKRKKSKH